MPATFDQRFRTLRADLVGHVGRDRLAALHRRSGWRHAAVALRQLLILALAAGAIVVWGDRPWVWIPAAVVIGFVVFGLTVLLHEVVHGTVFGVRRPRAERLLAWAYAVPSGLSATQFSRWHLDHHRWLGTSDSDPKRAHLSPKRNARWLKALYLTPALFPIYFRAARRAAADYPEALRRRIGRERGLATAFHLALLAGLILGLGLETAAKLHLVPVFLVFPIAFTLNRLGQHYDVDGTDVARWGTLMAPSPWLWDVVFLWSNYHLEHHYFPRVPMDRLPALRRALDPFFEARGMRTRTYAGLLADWFGRNRPPHADWSVGAASAASCTRD